MLEQLLAEIREGGSLETRTLAIRLGTSPQMVAAMLDHCRRMGLLADYASCTDGCAGCGIREACSHNAGVRLWQDRGL